MRLAAHDQLALLAFAAGPAGETGGNDLLRELVEFGLALLQPLLGFGPDLGKGAAADARVEEIGGLDQRRGRQTDRNIEDAVFDLTVLGNEDHERTFGLEPDEFYVLEPLVRLRGQDHAGGAA